jgi:sarcosine oxidase/L-pipecolate oxidase/L-saccharopine oxidase
MENSVLVVGCGIFGLASALEFAKNGYDVTAIDAYAPPSPWSAACDYNKIVRAEYGDEVYTKLSIEAIELWKNDPLFKGIYNNCGRVMITPRSFKARKEFEHIGIANMQKFGKAIDVEYFQGSEKLARRFNFLKYSSLKDDETSKFNPYGGLAHSSNAMVAVYEEAKKLGVKFIFGEAGYASKLETNCDGKPIIITKTGLELTADKIIISLGANTGSVVNLENQQSATGLFVTFIRLTDQEYEKYNDCAVLFDAEMGYFFPPDPETKLLKVALPGSGARNMVDNPHSTDSTISLPRFKNLNPEDTIPISGKREAKLLLAKYVPELAYHKLIDSKICWIGDTEDSNFIIDNIPGFENVYVAAGDSGHAFKFLPNIGKYIYKKINGNLDPKLTKMWSWKKSEGFDPAKCTWRLASNYPDLCEVKFLKELNSKL